MQVKSIAECSKGKHSALFSTFIKLPFVIKIFVLSVFEWPLYHTGKCICPFAGYLRILPALHRPDVVDIGVTTISKNVTYAKGTIEFDHFKQSTCI